MHLLEWPGLWGGKAVRPVVETTVVIEGVRFALDPDTGRARLICGDDEVAQPAVDLLKHNGLTA